MRRRTLTDRDNAWEAYCAAERHMFEQAAEYLKVYSPSALRRIHEEADQTPSDIAPVIEMMLGEKEVPEGWNIPRA